MKNNKKKASRFELIYLVVSVLIAIFSFCVAIKEKAFADSLIISLFFFACMWICYLLIKFVTYIIYRIIKTPKQYLYIILSLIGFPFLFYLFVCLLKARFISPYDLNKDEWINIFGEVLGYYGSCLLGTLAFWQNDKAYKINEKLFEYE